MSKGWHEGPPPVQTEQNLRRAAELLQQAGGFYSRGQFVDALKLASQALTFDPQDANLHNLMGGCAIKLGDQSLAERSWLRAAALQPQQAQFQLNLGVLLAGQGREPEAETRFRQALLLNPDSTQACYNLGYLLSSRGRLSEAETLYRRTLALAPNHLESLYNLAVMFGDSGRDAAAEEYYRRILALQPRHVDAMFNLGGILGRQQRPAEAQNCFRRVLELDPSNAAAHFNLGNVLAGNLQDEDAERCYRRSIELDAGAAPAWAALGALLSRRSQYDEAERCCRHALRLDPAYATTYYNLGVILAFVGRQEEAEHCYRQVLARDAGYADASFNLGILLTERGQYDEAEQCYRRALALKPALVQASRNLATLLLQQGRFKEGWVHYEARYDVRLPGRMIVPPENMPFPQWQGQRLDGKSLLILPEQGYGDQIQMCRYLPLLKRQGAARLTLACAPALRSLFQTLDGVDAVVDEDQVPGGQPHDYWSLLLSVPRWCGTEDGKPPHPPYLRAAPARVAHWSARLPVDGIRVGLVWKGSNAHKDDALRSLSRLDALRPLWSVPGISFISLQKGQGEDEARQPLPGQPLLHLGSDMRDFADMAAIVAQLDLLICVDTAAAHLAGALGRPCWVLRPPTAEWRWPPPGCGDSIWYPGTTRLFGGERGESWDAPIAEMREALFQFMTSRGASV